MTFEASFARGVIGESAIARYLVARGHSVLPAYEKAIDAGKGPRLYTPRGELVAPDLLAFNASGVLWVEAKHKTGFSWHRITREWVTGIDLHHYEQYQRVEDELGYLVWLMFLQRGGGAKDSPSVSPSGLYGHLLSYLVKNEHHRHVNHGRHGMVYWSDRQLCRLASIEDVIGTGLSRDRGGEDGEYPEYQGASVAGDSI